MIIGVIVADSRGSTGICNTEQCRISGGISLGNVGTSCCGYLIPFLLAESHKELGMETFRPEF